MEKLLSRYTDQQLCINREDYELAKRKFHAKYVDYVPGVGIDGSQFRTFGDKERQKKRESLGILSGQVVLLTSGEMIPRKNQEVLFRMLAKIKDEAENLRLLLCGHGELNEYLHGMADELGIADRISFWDTGKIWRRYFRLRISSFFHPFRKGCRGRCWRLWPVGFR